MVPAHDFMPAQKHFDYANSLPNRANLLKPDHVKNVQYREPLLEFSGACAGCGETAIVKMITQLWGDRSYMTFATGCPVVWGASAPSNAFTKNKKGKGPAWSSSLYEDHAEFGFGQYKALQLRRANAKAIVAKIERESQDGEGKKAATNLLESWDTEESENYAQEFLLQLRQGRLSASPEDIRAIEREKDFLGQKINWIIGGDGWAYDIGYGGLDHIIASGENVKVLVLDTEVYSNTGGQPSKSSARSSSNQFSVGGVARAKKDLALLMQTYGNVYVANTCLDANPSHALQCLQEAVSYNGPAIVINYSPCIEHGFNGGLGKANEHTKKLIEAGYLILSRYDPRLEKPLQIDSRKPTFEIDEVLNQEVRFANLKKRDEKRYKELRAKLHEDVRSRYAKYTRLVKSFETSN